MQGTAGDNLNSSLSNAVNIGLHDTAEFVNIFSRLMPAFLLEKLQLQKLG